MRLPGLAFLTLFVLLICLFFAPGCRQERAATRMMTWEPWPQERNPNFPEADCVILHFVESPKCFEVVHQPNLITQLDSAGRSSVPVEFIVTSGNLGKGTAAYRIVRINDRKYLTGAYSNTDNGGCSDDGRQPLDIFP